MARGGKRTPTNPAPVSGPGALSQRTDGGPGNPTQPVRVPTGGAYGEAQALREQQQAAPLPATTGPNTPQATGTTEPPVPGGVFGPTQRPYESPLAGAPVPGQQPYDVDDLFRLMYSVFPNPKFLSLIKR